MKFFRRNWPILLAAGFMLVSLGALGFALSFRAADQRRLEEGRIENCMAIEFLKKQLRPEPFDVEETKKILRDLGIDPDSDRGRRLIVTSRERNAHERAALAPKEC